MNRVSCIRTRNSYLYLRSLGRGLLSGSSQILLKFPCDDQPHLAFKLKFEYESKARVVRFCASLPHIFLCSGETPEPEFPGLLNTPRAIHLQYLLFSKYRRLYLSRSTYLPFLDIDMEIRTSSTSSLYCQNSTPFPSLSTGARVTTAS